MRQRMEGDALRQVVFEFIVRYKREHDGVAPTIREIGEEIGVGSTSHVDYILVRLEERGLIVYPRGQSRAIRVVGGAWSYGVGGG